MIWSGGKIAGGGEIQVGLRRASDLILGLLLWPGVLASGAVLASPKAAVTPARASVESPEACSAGAIRMAAANQTAPAVTGCRYDAVAGPVAQFFLALPVAHKLDDPAALGTIIAQSPQAGQPLKPGGRLVLSVSTERTPKAEEATSSSVSSASSSSAGSSSTAPVPGRPPELKSEPVTPPQPDVPAEPEPPPAPAQASAIASSSSSQGQVAEIPGRKLPDAPWPWIAGFAALIVLIAVAAGTALRRGRSHISGLIAPAVSLRLTPGEARLKARGPLVKGRKGLKG